MIFVDYYIFMRELFYFIMGFFFDNTSLGQRYIYTGKSSHSRPTRTTNISSILTNRYKMALNNFQ